MPLPTVIVPGYLESAIAYRPLEQLLQKLGFPTVTVPIRFRDWLPTIGGRSMVPILRLIDRTVKQALQPSPLSTPSLIPDRDSRLAPASGKETNLKFSTLSNPVGINLIGHSAGGWISRIYLGEKPYTIHGDVTEDALLWNAHPYVATLVTLGTPHISGERWTRKNLDFVKINYPGAFYPRVQYVCVAGKTVFGARRPGQWLAHSSYKLTCGRGDTWGDGITPIEAAHLEGATNLVIEGVMHSPRSPKPWYGSPEPLQSWVSFLA